MFPLEEEEEKAFSVSVGHQGREEEDWVRVQQPVKVPGESLVAHWQQQKMQDYCPKPTILNHAFYTSQTAPVLPRGNSGKKKSSSSKPHHQSTSKASKEGPSEKVMIAKASAGKAAPARTTSKAMCDRRDDDEDEAAREGIHRCVELKHGRLKLGLQT